MIPADAKLTPRNEAFPAWESLPEDQKALYARQMEVYAGYLENADWNAGRVLDAIEEMGELDNTLVIYIWGDNGASMEGTLTGSFNELTMQNGIPLTSEQQLALIELYGGLDVWGTELTAPHYAAAWAWACNARSSGANRSPRTWVAPATRWSSAGRLDQGRGAVRSPLHPLHRHRPDHPRHRGHSGPPTSTASSSSQCMGPASCPPSPIRRRRTTHPAVLRDRGVPRHVQGRMVAGSMVQRIPWDLTPTP